MLQPHRLTLAGRVLAACLLVAFTARALAADVGVTDDRIVIAQSAAFSGPASQLGIQVNLGAKVYFDQINKAGGINGRRIELRVSDDAYEADRAAANTRKFVSDGVFALFGYVGTPTSNAALPVFGDAHVPFFAPVTGASSLRDPFNRYVFNVRASYFDETDEIVNQLVTTGSKRIGVFYQNDAYGKAGLDGVTRALDTRKLKVDTTGTVERNTVDVTRAVAAFQKDPPDAIVMVSAYASCAAFVKAMRAAGYTGQFHNVSFVGSTQLAEALGSDGIGVAISQVVPFPWAGASAVVREYQRAMSDAGNKDFNFSSLEGYIAAKVFVEGLRRAGRDLTRDRLIQSLETLNRFDLGGMSITFTPTNHNGSKYVDMTIIGSSGRFMH